MGVPESGGFISWKIHGKSYETNLKRMIIRGTPILGNLHIMGICHDTSTT